MKIKVLSAIGCILTALYVSGCGGSGGGTEVMTQAPAPVEEVKAVQSGTSVHGTIAALREITGASRAGNTGGQDSYSEATISLHTISPAGTLIKVSGVADTRPDGKGEFVLTGVPVADNMVILATWKMTDTTTAAGHAAMKVFSVDAQTAGGKPVEVALTVASTLAAEAVGNVLSNINKNNTNDEPLTSSGMAREVGEKLEQAIDIALGSASGQRITATSVITASRDDRMKIIDELANTMGGEALKQALEDATSRCGVRIHTEDNGVLLPDTDITLTNGEEIIKKMTDEGGNFYFGGIPPKAEIRITAKKPGYASESITLVTPGPGRTAQVVVKLSRSTANNKPVPRTSIAPTDNVSINTSVTLSANGSFDPDGDSLAYSWRQQAGPSVNLEGSGNMDVLFVPTLPGKYEFMLTLSDGVETTISEPVIVNVNSPICFTDTDCDDGDRLTKDACIMPGGNTANCTHTKVSCVTDADCDDGRPESQDICVNASVQEVMCKNTGAETTVSDTSITLDDKRATIHVKCAPIGTSDMLEARCNEGDEWAAVDGQSGKDCIYTTPGEYSPACRAEKGFPEGDIKQIEVLPEPNHAPNASISTDSFTGNAPVKISFSGTCTDKEGSCVSYSWDFGDGSAASTMKDPEHIFNTGGTYTTVLTVVDGDGAIASTAITIHVNNPPRVSLKHETAEATSPAVIFSAICEDADGVCDVCAWDFGDGATEIGMMGPSHTYAAGGVYTVSVKCTDNGGATAEVSATVRINIAPVVDIQADTISGEAPLAISFIAFCTDSDGTCVSYTWDFGDGSPSASTPSPVHYFSSAGSYTVSLTATDNDGKTSQHSMVVTLWGSQAKEVSAKGGDHNCALLAGGAVKCWGFNAYGQIGDGTKTNRVSPVLVSGLIGVKAVAAGKYHTCAIMPDTTVSCWGQNDYGQLGDGTKVSKTTPVKVAGISGAKAISLGRNHSCAILEGGGMLCWGANSYGQLGDGTNIGRTTPVAVSGLGMVSVMSAGENTTCAQPAIGRAKCWGENDYYNIGDGTLANKNVPTDINGLQGNVLSFAVGSYSSCALMDTQDVMCWGKSDLGGMGDGTNTARPSAVYVPGLYDVRSIAAGIGHMCAVTGNGNVKCWGYNVYGQIGDGSTAQRNSPVDVPGLSDAVNIAAGGYHACALRSGGDIVCWGYNNRGQLGDGTKDTKLSPVIANPI